MENRFKVIIFDFFGVFCSDLTLEWFGKQGREELRPQYEELCALSDRGEITKPEFFDRMAKLMGYEPDNVRVGIESEMIFDPQMAELARGLHRNYKIVLLSNSTPAWIGGILEQYDLGDIFDEIVLSSEAPAIKPEPGIYLYALEKIGLPAESAIFIDDRQKNIDGAEAVSIKGILYENMEQLKRDLKQLGIIDQEIL